MTLFPGIRGAQQSIDRYMQSVDIGLLIFSRWRTLRFQRLAEGETVKSSSFQSWALRKIVENLASGNFLRHLPFADTGKGFPPFEEAALQPLF